MKNRQNVSKVKRNDLCPCGSGKKYKKCCLNKERITTETLEAMYARKYHIRVKKAKDIEAIKIAGRLALDTLDMVESRLRIGMTTDEVNTLVHDFITRHNGIPAPLNYRGYPKSVCISINDEICHGIPGPRVIEDGDLVNVDVTPILNGYYADANKTFLLGTPSPDAVKLVAVVKQSLADAISIIKPGNTVGDIGWAIQQHAESNGCSVVREFVGHGVGFEFHEAPQIPHYGRRGEGITLIPGMVFTVEPMINLGKKELKVLDDQWTAVTLDGSLSAQFEQTLLVTHDGCESLTPYPLI